jgi:hypothetical protein
MYLEGIQVVERSHEWVVNVAKFKAKETASRLQYTECFKQSLKTKQDRLRTASRFMDEFKVSLKILSEVSPFSFSTSCLVFIKT